MAGIITITQMLNEMQKGKMFSIEYVQADINRGTAGTLRALTGVRRYDIRDTDNQPRVDMRGGKRKKNAMIKLYVPGAEKDKRLKDVHLYLITRFNGKEVA